MHNLLLRDFYAVNRRLIPFNFSLGGKVKVWYGFVVINRGGIINGNLWNRVADFLVRYLAVRKVNSLGRKAFATLRTALQACIIISGGI